MVKRIREILTAIDAAESIEGLTVQAFGSMSSGPTDGILGRDGARELEVKALTQLRPHCRQPSKDPSRDNFRLSDIAQMTQVSGGYDSPRMT